MRSRGSWELEFEDPRQAGAECARKPKGGPAHALSREAGQRVGLRTVPAGISVQRETWLSPCCCCPSRGRRVPDRSAGAGSCCSN